MTDPTPQADQEWFCVSCNHAHVMHQNVANGQSCHCGGCTAWVPKLRLAEPSPAPPAERVIEVAPQAYSAWTPEKEQEMLEKAVRGVERMNPNDNEANMISAVLRETLPEVAPQGEIPPRPPKQPAVHGCGEVYLVPDVEDYVKRMESSLTAAREERDRAKEALREMVRSAHPNRKEHPTMYKAWRNAEIVLGEFEDDIRALKPVSDQPQVENK